MQPLLQVICTKRKSYLAHENTYAGKALPNIKCDQSFVERAELLKHQESHICKKAFQCKTCNRHFLLKDNLKKHMVVHAKKKPCICSHSGLHFKNMIDLVNHEKKVRRIMTGVFSK